MRKITENELRRATGMLIEYMQIVEDPATDLANIDNQIKAARSQGNNLEVSRLSRERVPIAQQVAQLQRSAPSAIPSGLTLSPEAAKLHQTASAQLKAQSDKGDPTAKAAYDELLKTTATANTVTPSPVAGTTPTVTSTAQDANAQQYDDWASQSNPAAKPAAKPTAKSDPAVLKLQKELISKGANIKADGIMGPKTQAAMAQFQQRSTTPAAQPAPRLAAQPTTPAAQPAPRPDTVSQAMGSFATESVRYSEDPTLARIVGLAGL